MANISDNMRGAFLMMGSQAFFSLNDACLKLVSDGVPLFQLLAVRGALTTFLLVLLAQRRGGLRLDVTRSDGWLLAIRTVAEVVAAYFFITAIFKMPLANANAILQSLPLVVTLAGALFLGESFGWRRLVAILVGFVGVLLIVRPGAEGFTVYSLYVLISVAAVATRDLATRRISRDLPSMTVAITAAAGVGLFGALGSIETGWVMPTLHQAGLMGGMSVFIVGGYLLAVSCMRVGEIGAVAPFRYAGLVYALILGLVLFQDFPKPLTLFGAALVVGSGIFTLVRESRLKRAAGPVPLRIR